VAAAVSATSAIGISKALVRPYGAEQSQGDALGELLVVAGSAGEHDHIMTGQWLGDRLPPRVTEKTSSSPYS
jgi:hypothetical protein